MMKGDTADRNRIPPAGDMLYSGVLDALQDDHCGACQQTLKQVERFFEAFFYEQVNDPWSRERFISARGWCPVHAWRKPGMHDALGIAIIYQHLLQEFLAAYRGATEIAPAGTATWPRLPWSSSLYRAELRRGLAAWREPRGDCPVCVHQWAVEDRFAATVADALTYNEFRRRYQASFGLCVPHLLHTVKRIEPSESLDWLIATEREKMEHLHWELSEFIRKHDYRYTKEPKGRESTSWRRVIEKLAGAPGLVWRKTDSADGRER